MKDRNSFWEDRGVNLPKEEIADDSGHTIPQPKESNNSPIYNMKFGNLRKNAKIHEGGEIIRPGKDTKIL